MNTMNNIQTIGVKYELTTEGCDNFWEAHALIIKEAQIDGAEIHNVEYIGDSFNHLPMIHVTFQCVETAKDYTAVYLGLYRGIDDDEVNEYIFG